LQSVVAELGVNAPDFHAHQKKAMTQTPACLCLAWSDDGSTLYAGYTDHMIRVWAGELFVLALLTVSLTRIQ
jgi:hypothetical protein